MSNEKYVEKYGEQFLKDKQEVEEAAKQADKLFDNFAKKYPVSKDITWCIFHDGHIGTWLKSQSKEEEE